ncbi:MAG: ATP-dependent RecD-like DNA helicase [Blastocatellia bacterium]
MSSEILNGTVERITFQSVENGYSILRFSVPHQTDPVTVIGAFLTISPGENLRLTGFWTSHPKYGQQFKVTDYQITKPATIVGIQKYLGSGLIKGVGPVTAKRIVEHFGLDTLDIIENDIGRLSEVSGIARKRIARIQATWAEQRAIKDVMLFLQGHSISTHFAVKIFKTYGNEAISVVESNPYQLAADVYGIGFKTADQIAQNMGLAVDAPERLQAGLLYTLNQAAEQGHCYVPGEELVKNASEILGVESEPLGTALVVLESGSLIRTEQIGENSAVYLPTLWQAEQSVARRITNLLRYPVKVDLLRVDSWLERYAENAKLTLSPEQNAAILQAVCNRVMILTGGPGTGKTSTMKCLVELLRAMKKKVLLASPTGRAAQRLSEVTGMDALTIHRLLAFDPKNFGFKHNEENPLVADVVIVDEASMLDVVLANNLLKAIAPTTQLILVGDVDQLPSVGPGTVLRDLIESNSLPVTRLTQIFRQAAQSLIIQNAHRINQGEYPILIKPGERQADCYFIEATEPEEILEIIVKTVSQSLPNRLKFDPMVDIQVLTPMNRGTVGATNLNTILQLALNPKEAGKSELVRGGRILRVGDKVIQRVNNYDLEVFNGDMGRVEFVDLEDQHVVVRFGNNLVTYDYADILELGHAYAVSTHKSQGSEYPVVVIPVHTSHYRMLSRNLLYTALTRAKKLVVLVGTKKAIAAALHNVEAIKRYTMLKLICYVNHTSAN